MGGLISGVEASIFHSHNKGVINLKKRIGTLLAFMILLVSISTVILSFGNKDGPWQWTQTLAMGEDFKITAWKQGCDNTPLTSHEMNTLIQLLNNLTKRNFTQNKTLAGGTPEYGVIILESDIEFYLNESIAVAGGLELQYHGAQWWVDSPELSDFIYYICGKL